MKWIKYRLKIRDEAEDIVISALADAGVQGVEIEDSLALSDDELARMFVDIPPERRGEEGVAYLNFYLDPESEDTPAILARAKEELDALSAFCDIGEAAIEESETDNRDWENEWKKYFKPFRIDDILVVPSWAEDEPEGDASTVLCIDPGTAFGTGMHETTQLCIRQLRKHLKEGMRVLDIGTGSGCIACTLAAELPGAAVTAWDISPEALATAAENARRIGVRVTFQAVDILSPGLTPPVPSFDLIVSNPPYVCEHEKAQMSPHVVDFEPSLALFVPDADPLLFHRAIARFAAQALTPGGRLFFELNAAHAPAAADMLARLGYSRVTLREDQFGKQRFISACLPQPL